MDEIATYTDLLSPDSWLQLALSMQNALLTFNDLLGHENDLLNGIISNTNDELTAPTDLHDIYNLHIDISEVVNAEKRVDELAGKLESLQETILPITDPYTPYDYNNAVVNKQDTHGVNELNTIIKSGFSALTETALTSEGKNFSKVFLKNFGKNLISQTTDMVLDSGPAIMEESGIASLIGTFGEELIGIGLATSETGVGLIPLIAGAVLTGGSALYSYFEGDKQKQQLPDAKRLIYLNSQQEVPAVLAQSDKDVDNMFNSFSGKMINLLPNQNLPVTDATTNKLTAGKYRFAPQAYVPPVSQEIRNHAKEEARKDKLERIRIVGASPGAGNIVININKALIEHFTVNVKEMKESYDSLRNEVEKTILDVLHFEKLIK